MVEGFPDTLTTGTFDNAMKQRPGDWLKCESEDPSTQRFAIGTACLTGATAVLGYNDPYSATDAVSRTPATPSLGDPVTDAARAGDAWVRMFEYGAVVVNPSGKHLEVNLGTSFGTVAVGPGDATFCSG
jgi:hypothetical protein